MKTKLPKKMKKHLCIESLLKVARQSFAKVPDLISRKPEISLPDCLMSGLALFGLKFPSLLQFDKKRTEDKIIRHNLKTLYGIKQAPCDTYFRERLDPVHPEKLQRVMNRLLALVQRSKLLERYRALGDYYLVPIDGTGYFSSHEVHCESCCVKQHRDGAVTYYHQMLSAVLAHPDLKTVLPLTLEPITKQDGQSKNDCEHSAAKRLLKNLRQSHPHLKMVVVLDALYADGVMLKLLKELDLRFIITAKQSDLPYLFEFYRAGTQENLMQEEAGLQKRYTFAKDLPLNDTHSELAVQLVEYEETGKKGKKTFCWLTDLEINENTVEQFVRGGRARWRIENETFNTLKNQGYQFEHNFGHGDAHLSTVLAYLMFTAFLIDQIQELACTYFQTALKKYGGRLYVWQRIHGFFTHFLINSWEEFYEVLIGKRRGINILELLDSS